ncbi:hypothetical protein BMR59_19535 [Escherichia coli]|uniref:Uncharacterized protein n=2 Tax=Escherichia coli TaxID=562 RepID=A0A2H9C5H8_ECOLX|nr:hypothetical protein CRN16_03610 [Escherichia coli]EFO0323464.1 hypothetical protein [Escherichia albertii]OYG21190.1 hypothetical protein CI650_01820 [Shigella sonnei]ATX36964.1 hypothetical protein CUC42_19185 [Escherichia coli]AUK02543.1 hypothetical protein CR538_20205 [Escherichia coli]
MYHSIYTRHTSSCMYCDCVRSPQSLTLVSSWRFTRLSPSCNSNYLEYINIKNQEMADESRARKKELILERSAKSH